MPLTPAHERLRQADLCELEATLVYIVSAKAARTIERPYLKKTQYYLHKGKKKPQTKFSFEAQTGLIRVLLMLETEEFSL